MDRSVKEKVKTLQAANVAVVKAGKAIQLGELPPRATGCVTSLIAKAETCNRLYLNEVVTPAPKKA